MATRTGSVNFEEDHPRWEEYKFECLRHPSLDEVTDRHRARPARADKGPKPRRSLVRKEGHSNVEFRGVKKKARRYVQDLYVTLLEMRWRWVVLIFFASFLAFYGIFATWYYFLAWLHGDFANLGNPDFVPCIQNMKNAWDAFLLSIETQSTIGYGIVYAHPECGSTLPVIYLQIVTGFLFETLVFGFVFAKLARPKHRRHTIVFSRNACISQEGERLVLQIRVGDMRRSNLVDARVHGLLVKRHVIQEKYVYPLYQHQLEFNAHEMGDRLFLMWPLVLTHHITEDSPLWTLTPGDLIFDKFEIVVFLEGYIESTGEMCQARTSYTTREIIWGHRFTRLEEYDPKNDLWIMDFVKFNKVVPSDTPACSAAQLMQQSETTVLPVQRSSSQPGIRQSYISVDDDFDTASESPFSDDEHVVGDPIRIPFTPMPMASPEEGVGE